MAVAVGEEEEQPLRLDARALSEKLLHHGRPEVGEAFEQFVGRVESDLGADLLEQFERCPLGTGQSHELVPGLVPRGVVDGTAQPAGAELKAPPLEPELRFAEEPAPAEPHVDIQREPGQPTRGGSPGIVKPHTRLPAEIEKVAESEKIERGRAADMEGVLDQTLRRHDGKLPANRPRSRRSTVHARHEPLQPPALHIIVDAGMREPLCLQPVGIDEQPGGKALQEPVQMIAFFYRHA